MSTVFTVILTAVISAALALSVYLLIKNIVLKNKKERILMEAEKEGENIKKEKIFQAKEKFLQLKTEHEHFINEKNAQIQASLDAKRAAHQAEMAKQQDSEA